MAWYSATQPEDKLVKTAHISIIVSWSASRLLLATPLRMKGNLIVKDDAEEGAVHGQAAVVLDNAQLPELVHEVTDSGPRGADHLGQRFLANLRKGRPGLVYLPKVGQQQQHPCQPLLAGIKELIHQILFDPLFAGPSGAISETNDKTLPSRPFHFLRYWGM